MNSHRQVQKKRKFLGSTGKRISSVSDEIMDKSFLFASIVESSDDAIITKTSKGTITFWNTGAEKIYGFPTREVLLPRGI